MLKESGKELIAEVENSSFLQGKVVRVKAEGEEQDGEVEAKAKHCHGDVTTGKGGDLFRLRVDHCRHHHFHRRNGAEGRTFSVKLLSSDDGRKDIVSTVQALCRDGAKPADLTIESFQKSLAGMVSPQFVNSRACVRNVAHFVASRFWRVARPQPDAQV
jgi:hypothetical protein